MTTLSASRTRAYTNTNINGLLVPAATTIYAGAAVGVNEATGNPRPLQAGDKFIGFAQSSVNHIRGQEREAPLTVVDSGQVALQISGAVATDIGKDVFATDDDTFTFSSSGGSLVGVAKQLLSAGRMLVEILPPSALNGVRLAPGGTALVSGDGTPINLTPSGLWATRATLAAAGITSAFFTDVGVGGSFWFYAGGRWRPVGGRVTLKNLTTDVSNNGAPKVVMDWATIPAGAWQDGDIIRAHIVKERTGGTSDTDATDVLLGTVAATLGTTLNLTTSALATTAISLALNYAWRRVSSTSVRSQGVPGATGIGTSTSANSLITGLSNLDSVETYLQVSSDLTTAGGEVAWLRGYTVELIAGA